MATKRTKTAKALLADAAPDLLAAAKAALEHIARLPPTRERVELVEQLVAAISKATGA